MSNGTEMNFDVIREPWNIYELEDHILIKIRLILKRVFRNKAEEKTGYNLGSQNLTVITHVPDELKGSKTKN